MHRAPFAATQLRTHVSRLPALLGDRTAWNKVFRRSFWDEHGFTFPEGVLYEDIPVTVPGARARHQRRRLDVPVYYWREREGPDQSITQRREEIGAFTDRLENCWGVSRVLGEPGHHRIKRLYDESVLKSDLMLFLRVLPTVDDDYRRVFLDRTNAYLDTVDPEAILELPADACGCSGRWSGTGCSRDAGADPVLRKQGRIARRGLRRYHDMDLYHERLPQLPPELFAAGTPRPRTKVHDVSWQDGKLRIRGHAFIPGQSGGPAVEHLPADLAQGAHRAPDQAPPAGQPPLHRRLRRPRHGPHLVRLVRLRGRHRPADAAYPGGHVARRRVGGRHRRGRPGPQEQGLAGDRAARQPGRPDQPGPAGQHQDHAVCRGGSTADARSSRCRPG